jgi:hypothetical protein
LGHSVVRNRQAHLFESFELYDIGVFEDFFLLEYDAALLTVPDLEDGGTTCLRKVGNRLPSDAASYLKITELLYTYEFRGLT